MFTLLKMCYYTFIILYIHPQQELSGNLNQLINSTAVAVLSFSHVSASRTKSFSYPTPTLETFSPVNETIALSWSEATWAMRNGTWIRGGLEKVKKNPEKLIKNNNNVNIAPQNFAQSSRPRREEKRLEN